MSLGGEVRDRAIAYVLDASALLAMLQNEPGGGLVRDVLTNSIVSSVNLAEVLQRLTLQGAETEPLAKDLASMGLGVLKFDSRDAARVASLIRTTRPHGLSLGDRACLALAARWEIPALTGDRAWAEIDFGPEPIQVELIR